MAFGSTAGDAHRILLALHSGTIPGGALGTRVVRCLALNPG